MTLNVQLNVPEPGPDDVHWSESERHPDADAVSDDRNGISCHGCLLDYGLSFRGSWRTIDQHITAQFRRAAEEARPFGDDWRPL